MEMNTRLQVEHPVTEMITGEDLVEWQLRVAAGEELPKAQDELAISGHSVEVRLYAEDPDRNFMPSIGTLEHLRFPEGSERLRIETGVRGGDEVSMFYDPMIAKLVTWGPDRAAAVHGMVSALGATEVVGVTTNLRFLRDVLDHPAFVKAELDTRFIERHEGDLFPERGPADPQMVALAVLAELKREQAAQAREAATSGDPHSPWAALQGWRLNGPSHEVVHLRDGETVLAVNARHVEGGGFALAWDGAEIAAHGELLDDGALVATIDGVRLNATAIWHGEDLVVMTHARSHRFASADPRLAKFDADAVGGAMTAPMPGKVISVMVEVGKSVRKGAALMVLEAMKMEHTIAAPANGTVAAINYGEGDLVEEGAELLEFEAERD
jgi:3-methylcrotonyl-CoA carboxylase alpha subunit